MKEKDLAAVIGDVNEEYVVEASKLRRRSRAARIGVIAAAMALTLLLTVGWIVVRDLRKPAEIEQGTVYPPERNPNAKTVLGGAYLGHESFSEIIEESDHIIIGTVKNWVAENMFCSVFEVEVERSLSGNVPETVLVACRGSSMMPYYGEKGSTTQFTCGYRGLLLIKEMEDGSKETFGLNGEKCYWLAGGDSGLFDLVSDGQDLYVYARDYEIGEKLAKELSNYAGNEQLKAKLIEYLRATDPELFENDDYRFDFLFKLNDLTEIYFR